MSVSVRRLVGVALTIVFVLVASALAWFNLPHGGLTLASFPAATDRQFYLLAGDVVVRHQVHIDKKVHDDHLVVFGARDGKHRFDLTFPAATVHGQRWVDGLYVATVYPQYVDERGVVYSDPSAAETVAYDGRTGTERWRHGGEATETRPGLVIVAPNGGGGPAAGLDPATGAIRWTSPYVHIGAVHASPTELMGEEPDGSVRTIDITTGMASPVLGHLPAQTSIRQVGDRFLSVTAWLGDGDDDTVHVYDRHTFRLIRDFEAPAGLFPSSDRWCGDLFCVNGEGDVAKVASIDTGADMWLMPNFDIDTGVVNADGSGLLFGGFASPIGDSVLRIVDLQTGAVRRDLPGVRPLRLVGTRLYVGEFASRGYGQLLSGADADADTRIGYVDLTPGSTLQVTRIADLNASYEDCDLDRVGLFCDDSFTGEAPALFDLGLDVPDE
jgi:outer membrane protein assembly factor BamB